MFKISKQSKKSQYSISVKLPGHIFKCVKITSNCYKLKIYIDESCIIISSLQSYIVTKLHSAQFQKVILVKVISNKNREEDLLVSIMEKKENNYRQDPEYKLLTSFLKIKHSHDELWKNTLNKKMELKNKKEEMKHWPTKQNVDEETKYHDGSYQCCRQGHSNFRRCSKCWDKKQWWILNSKLANFLELWIFFYTNLIQKPMPNNSQILNPVKHLC